MPRDQDKIPPLAPFFALLSTPSQTFSRNSPQNLRNFSAARCQKTVARLKKPATYRQSLGGIRSPEGVCVLVDDFVQSLTCYRSLGGLCGAIVTSPFDVVKTRLQSSLFREGQTAVGVFSSGGGGASAVLQATPRHPGLLWNFVETGHILRYADLLAYLLRCLSLTICL